MADATPARPKDPDAPDGAEKPRSFSYLPSLDKLPRGVRAVALPAPGGEGEYQPIGLFGDGGGRFAVVRVWGLMPVVGGGHVGQFLGTLALAGVQSPRERLESALVGGCVELGFGTIMVELGSGDLASTVGVLGSGERD